MVKNMIGNNNRSVSEDDGSVKVVEDEESREEEPGAPEWRRNPGVQVIVIPWRRIVSNHRWAFFVVIIVEHRRFSVLRACRRLIFGILTRSIGEDRQTKFCRNAL
jgi:hypothetical protein